MVDWLEAHNLSVRMAGRWPHSDIHPSLNLLQSLSPGRLCSHSKQLHSIDFLKEHSDCSFLLHFVLFQYVGQREIKIKSSEKEWTRGETVSQKLSWGKEDNLAEGKRSELFMGKILNKLNSNVWVGERGNQRWRGRNSDSYVPKL